MSESESGEATNYQPIQDPEPVARPEGDKFLLVVKFLNMGAGLFVSFIGLWTVITLNLWDSNHKLASFYTFFLPFFFIVFGGLLVAAEFAKDFINLYFSFLRSYLGRGLFNLFLVTQSVHLFGLVSDVFFLILTAFGVVFLFLHFIEPKVSGDVKKQLLD